MNDQATPDHRKEKEPGAESTTRRRFYVDFWDDMENEWSNCWDRGFNTLGEAIEACKKLQAELPKRETQSALDDHYGVIDGARGLEVYCGHTGQHKHGAA